MIWISRETRYQEIPVKKIDFNGIILVDMQFRSTYYEANPGDGADEHHRINVDTHGIWIFIFVWICSNNRFQSGADELPPVNKKTSRDIL